MFLEVYCLLSPVLIVVTILLRRAFTLTVWQPNQLQVSKASVLCLLGSPELCHVFFAILFDLQNICKYLSHTSNFCFLSKQVSGPFGGR